MRSQNKCCATIRPNLPLFNDLPSVILYPTCKPIFTAVVYGIQRYEFYTMAVLNHPGSSSWDDFTRHWLDQLAHSETHERRAAFKNQNRSTPKKISSSPLFQRFPFPIRPPKASQ